MRLTSGPLRRTMATPPSPGGVATGGGATGGVATGGVATGGVATGGVATGGVATGFARVRCWVGAGLGRGVCDA